MISLAFMPVAVVGAVFLLLIVVIVLVLVGLYNNFVRLRNRVDNAWAQIEVQVQRRRDLIPNVVETVKGYAAHESSTLQRVVDARNTAMGARSVGDLVAAENQITSALRQLFALAENYPDLKANMSFLDLQAQLRDTEDKISHMRLSFNDCVMAFNNALQTFPGVVVAKMFGFTSRELFDAVPDAQVPPSVAF
ncbi:MAG: LemA family protein [Coriobacteriales bacterium]|nr:LemA family protein [Coriobacteriales bacterium]